MSRKSHKCHKLKVLESVSFFSRGQKVLRFSALFCLLSLNMLGRQQWQILLVEKDQQVLQLGKTIPKRSHPYTIHMH
jgi:hypothetical protein